MLNLVKGSLLCSDVFVLVAVMWLMLMHDSFCIPGEKDLCPTPNVPLRISMDFNLKAS